MFPLISFFLCFTGVALYLIVMVCSVPSFVYFCSVVLFIPKPRSEDTKVVIKSHNKTNNDQQNSTQKT